MLVFVDIYCLGKASRYLCVSLCFLQFQDLTLFAVDLFIEIKGLLKKCCVVFAIFYF